MFFVQHYRIDMDISIFKLYLGIQAVGNSSYKNLYNPDSLYAGCMCGCRRGRFAETYLYCLAIPKTMWLYVCRSCFCSHSVIWKVKMENSSFLQDIILTRANITISSKIPHPCATYYKKMLCIFDEATYGNAVVNVSKMWMCTCMLKIACPQLHIRTSAGYEE